ncbi:hypothetical protein GCM10010103_75370 [Streptomyces paradoxus]
MGVDRVESNDRGRITPDSLWDLVRPLLPPSRVRPQGCGTQDPPDEAVFAAIVCVLESGCAWRALPAPRRQGVRHPRRGKRIGVHIARKGPVKASSPANAWAAITLMTRHITRHQSRMAGQPKSLEAQRD